MHLWVLYSPITLIYTGSADWAAWRLLCGAVDRLFPYTLFVHLKVCLWKIQDFFFLPSNHGCQSAPLCVTPLHTHFFHGLLSTVGCHRNCWDVAHFDSFTETEYKLTVKPAQIKHVEWNRCEQRENVAFCLFFQRQCQQQRVMNFCRYGGLSWHLRSKTFGPTTNYCREANITGWVCFLTSTFILTSLREIIFKMCEIINHIQALICFCRNVKWRISSLVFDFFLVYSGELNIRL